MGLKDWILNNSSYTEEVLTIDEHEEIEEDGLGYYADGTKRTLTDQQIAFFRSSELKHRVRESQLKNQKAISKITTKHTKNALGNTSTFSRAIATHTICESVEETKAFTPIANPSQNYTAIFGSQFAAYVLQLDQNMDNRYIETARRRNVEDYYPVLPIQEP